MHRTIVEENSYVIELYRLAEEYPRVFDVNDGIKWELARRPDAGVPVQPRSSYRVYNSTALGATPSFSVLYLYDEVQDPDCVYLYSVRARVDDD